MKKYKFFDDNSNLERGFSGLIYNQHTPPVCKIKYGKYPLSYNGCEIIAVYNALNLLGENFSLSEIIYEFEANKLTKFNLSFLKSHPTKLKLLPYILLPLSKLNLNFKSGVFGTNPKLISRFFDAHKINYRYFENSDETQPEEKIFIVSFWNESKLSSMVHTFVLSRDNSGNYRSYNGYNDGKIYKNINEIENDGAKFICGYALKGETSE